jgi:2-polyprenyl-3-methyl-5-hydroxy-6-metoxy-1,4-benzoquinol methylase
VAKEKNVGKFNQDVMSHGGYVYTSEGRLSSRLANRRLSEAIAALASLKGRRVVDLGCGDGTYTFELAGRGPSALLGVDGSKNAVASARKKAAALGLKKARFETMDIYAAGKLRGKFDVAVVRGLLHHLYDPAKAVLALAPAANVIVVAEPNGYNPVLKLLERFSRYHIEHEEKSFRSGSLDAWFEAAGGRVTAGGYRGLVPFFCPDWMAKTLKFIEPLVEATPLLNRLLCAVYVFRVEMPPPRP